VTEKDVLSVCGETPQNNGHRRNTPAPAGGEGVVKVTKSDALNNCTRLHWKSFFFDLFGQRKRLEGKAGGRETKREEVPALKTNN